MSLNQELSALFQTLAAVLEIKGESVFKAIAFSKVSRTLGDMTSDIRGRVESGTLKDVEGIGDSSRKIIEEYVRTGRSTDADELRASVPASLLPLLEIPGLGPKTIHLLWKERNILSIEDLVKALDTNALAGLKGIGAKKIEAIKNGIALRAQSAGRLGLPDALEIGQSLLERLRALPEVAEAHIAGSLRRRRETIGDVDLLCAPKPPAGGEPADAVAAGIASAFVKFPEVQKVLVQGITKASVFTAGGLQVDLRIVPPQHMGAALLYFTGSKAHNVKLRGRAIALGMTLNEWGLYRDITKSKQSEPEVKKETGKPPAAKPVASKTESEVYAALGLAYIEPELREDRGEVESATSGTAQKLPKLLARADIRGDLHSHTTASDGTASIEQMVEAAIALGYEYLAITDHSKSQVIANGLSVERLLKHIEAIHRVGEKIKGITLLAGCEVDILADGRLDYEDAVLKELDIVVASPHISLNQDATKATDRLMRAIEHPYVNIIGHPTGRLIDRRAGLPLEFDKLFAIAAKTGTAMEINAGYPRLDLNEINARAAIAAGVKLAIDTDAHAPAGLDEIELGVAVARRAWVEAGDIINCWPARQLMQFIRNKRP
ncbi:MAG TPA: DNA polymerase/3'-5' exonuclease PolX [Tepidisphaeraceae bacterium]|jgi:DNA polymerase (family 10)|nr:DNA polymerase/3'-5' exonuclease PolX [Tepidisphaeraceae bacterium]